MKERAPSRPTGRRIHDVAVLAGVSVGTVSNYFNHPERVSPEAMERVEAAIREVGYVRNAAARQLRLGESTSIGLVLLDVGNPFFTDIARAAEDAASQHGLTVILGNSDENVRRESSYLDLFERQRLRGVLVSPVGDVVPRLHQLKLNGIPAVLVDRSAPDGTVSSVSVDDESGGYQVARHLLDGGRRHIAYVSGPVSVQQSIDRFQGARRAVAETPGARIEFVELHSASVLEGRVFGSFLQSRDPVNRPDAVFAVNDVVALGVLQGISLTQSLRVPHDVAVVGYDDVDFAGELIVPLSSVRQPSRRLGETAFELLLELMEDPDRPPRSVVYEPEFVMRESSKPAEQSQLTKG